MNEKEIKQLEDALDDGNFQVYFMPNEALLKRVDRVEPLPPAAALIALIADKSPVAYLANGDWISLANFTMSHFYMVRPLSDMFE